MAVRFSLVMRVTIKLSLASSSFLINSLVIIIKVIPLIFLLLLGFPLLFLQLELVDFTFIKFLKNYYLKQVLRYIKSQQPVKKFIASYLFSLN